MIHKLFSLSRLFLFQPRQAARAAQDEKNLGPSLWIYLAFMASYLLFFFLKPWNFPDRNAPYPAEPQDLFFWFKVALWQPPLEAAWIAFLMGLIVWLKEGRLALRSTAAVLWAAGPFLLMIGYALKGGLPKTALAAGGLALFGLFIPLLRRAPRAEWRPLIAFMLGINAIGAALLIPMGLSVKADSPELYMASQALGALWMLGAGSLGVRELSGLRLPRAFLALLLSMFFQLALVLTLHLLGLVPPEILKALLYV